MVLPALGPALSTAWPYIVKGAEWVFTAINVYTAAKEVPEIVEKTEAVIDGDKEQIAPLVVDAAVLGVTSYFGVKGIRNIVNSAKASSIVAGATSQTLSTAEKNISISNVKELGRTAVETKVPKINDHLAGKVHPEANVRFVKKTIEVDGVKIERVFPKFDAKFEAKLPKELYIASDGKQFAECNRQLLEKINKNKQIAQLFNPMQLEQIRNMDTPDGYTWHHNETEGRMQLVDALQHKQAGHVGGKCIWGGGAINR